VPQLGFQKKKKLLTPLTTYHMLTSGFFIFF